MAADVALHFDRVRTRGDHGDLRLRLGSYRHTCDSYYFALDDGPAVAGGLGPRLAQLVGQWAAHVARLEELGGVAHLPYDFSDQCTAWLRVSSGDGRNAEVQAGWSPIEGWAITPSDYLATAPGVTDFEPINGARVECSLAELTARLDAIRTALAATGP
ncbi:hypothetical protein ABZ934_19365 [Streptomyces sp. NPDC046557]|uniref:hypothetical protein n=1 Tax=Streptomyces sp. NPDC046557 TaxID=3155372 RepID=UPI0033E4C3F0